MRATSSRASVRARSCPRPLRSESTSANRAAVGTSTTAALINRRRRSPDPTNRHTTTAGAKKYAISYAVSAKHHSTSATGSSHHQPSALPLGEHEQRAEHRGESHRQQRGRTTAPRHARPGTGPTREPLRPRSTRVPTVGPPVSRSEPAARGRARPRRAGTPCRACACRGTRTPWCLRARLRGRTGPACASIRAVEADIRPHRGVRRAQAVAQQEVERVVAEVPAGEHRTEDRTDGDEEHDGDRGESHPLVGRHRSQVSGPTRGRVACAPRLRTERTFGFGIDHGVALDRRFGLDRRLELSGHIARGPSAPRAAIPRTGP